jgi:hypothetical protein
MKAKLEFNLPEELDDFSEAVNGGKWKFISWQLDQWLRGRVKYATDGESADKINAFQEVRDELNELIRTSGINIDV